MRGERLRRSHLYSQLVGLHANFSPVRPLAQAAEPASQNIATTELTIKSSLGKFFGSSRYLSG